MGIIEETIRKRSAERAALDALLDYSYSSNNFSGYSEWQLLIMAVTALQELRKGQEKVLEAMNDLKDAVEATRSR